MVKSWSNVNSIKYQAHVNAIEVYLVQRQAQNKYFHCGTSGYLCKECRDAPTLVLYRAPPGPCEDVVGENIGHETATMPLVILSQETRRWASLRLTSSG